MKSDRHGKPNSVVDDHLSGPHITVKLERRSFKEGTALHRDKNLAVSAGLNRVVSVRISRLAADGRYPLPCCSFLPVFGLSSLYKCIERSPMPVLLDYTTPLRKRKFVTDVDMLTYRFACTGFKYVGGRLWWIKNLWVRIRSHLVIYSKHRAV